MRTVLFVLKFFLLGAFFIISNHNLALSVPEHRGEFVSDYKAWLLEITNNVVSATGNIVKLEWLPNTGVEGSSKEATVDFGKMTDSVKR